MAAKPPHGARVHLLPPNTLIVQQTVLKGTNPGRHIIEHDEHKKMIYVHVPINDDKALGEAIRAAVSGTLKAPKASFRLGSVEYEEGMQAEMEREWEGMDETDASNEEYFSDLMQRDD